MKPKSDRTRCQFSFADGRQCRMPRWQSHRNLCVHHAREQHKLLSAHKISRELTSLSGEFKTASDINHALGKVFSFFAQHRIDRRDAVAFAYISQLLLQSLPSVKREVTDAFGFSAWKSAVESVLREKAPGQNAEVPAKTALSPRTSPGQNAVSANQLSRLTEVHATLPEVLHRAAPEKVPAADAVHGALPEEVPGDAPGQVLREEAPGQNRRKVPERAVSANQLSPLKEVTEEVPPPPFASQPALGRYSDPWSSFPASFHLPRSRT